MSRVGGGRAGLLVGGLSVAGLAGLALAALAFLAHAIAVPLLPGEGASGDGGSTQPDSPLLAALDMPSGPPFVADALVERPLFSPTRTRPPPPAPPAEVALPVAAPAPPEDPVPVFSVSGILTAPSGHMALLRREGQTRPAWIVEGQRGPDGWLLAAVRPDGVLLVKGAKEIAFRLTPSHAVRSQFAKR